jgi:purine-nucleoside phosphorylase
VLVASAAEAKDGVSTAYDPSATTAYPDADLLARVGQRALVGPVCSVAAVHLEDQDLVNRCMAAGVLGLDLEVASFYTVARLREAAAIAILTVSDVPARGACADGPLLGKGARLTLELAVSLALEMEQAR